MRAPRRSVVIGLSLAAAVVAATLVTSIISRPLEPTVVVISPSPPPLPTVTSTGSPSAAATTAPGAVVSIDAEPEMVAFFADGGAVYAWWTASRPPPNEGRIMRADPPSGPWRVTYRTDAHIPFQKPAGGRVALLEYREPFQGGGAFSQDLVVVDLANGTPRTIDRWAMSAATFRGGGGGPRRVVSHFALSERQVAWTRLIERPGGAIEGELRHAPLSEPTRSTVIGSSTEWIVPVAIDDRTLVYVIGRSTGDELHARDLASGADMIVTTTAPPATNGYYPLTDVAVAGQWITWLDRGARAASGAAVTIRAVHVMSGEQRTVDAGGTSCASFSANARYIAWNCGPSNAPARPQVLDVSRWTLVDVVPAGAAGAFVQASGDALIWTERTATGRRVHLVR